MAVPGALHLALDLAATPVLAGMARRQRLPADVLVLIKIAGGCRETSREAERLTGKSPEVVRQAAELYLETMLFIEDGDSYRVLGVNRDAPAEVIQQHLRWLMKWLHPDRQRSEWQSAFAERVLRAWEDVKTPQRRAEYDRSLAASGDSRGRGRRRARLPWIAAASGQPGRTRSRRIAIAAAVGIAAVTFLLVPAWMTWLRGDEDEGLAGRVVDTAGVDATPAGSAASAAGAQ